jgi:hypothetical protein
MRFWKAGEGRTLVEADERAPLGAPGARFVTPAGESLESAGVYWLVEATGEVSKVYGFRTDSDQEDLLYAVHAVRGAELREWLCVWSDSQFGPEPPRTSERVVLSGLAECAAPSPRFGADAARAAREFLRTSRPAAPAPKSPRLESPEQLPELTGGEALDLVLDEAGADIVLRAGGRELWREPFFDSGSRRPRELEALARRRYGVRVRSFESRVEYGD